MKASYRGFEIDVHREKCLAGYELTYFSIYRTSDGFECVCDFTTGSDSVREIVRSMKTRIDNELNEADPWCEMESAEVGK